MNLFPQICEGPSKVEPQGAHVCVSPWTCTTQYPSTTGTGEATHCWGQLHYKDHLSCCRDSHKNNKTKWNVTRPRKQDIESCQVDYDVQGTVSTEDAIYKFCFYRKSHLGMKWPKMFHLNNGISKLVRWTLCVETRTYNNEVRLSEIHLKFSVVHRYMCILLLNESFWNFAHTCNMAVPCLVQIFRRIHQIDL